LLVLMAFFGMQAPAVDSFSVFFDVSFGSGHGAFLRCVCQHSNFRRKPCPIWGRKGQDFYGANKLCISD
jgi:hypothetical protein